VGLVAGAREIRFGALGSPPDYRYRRAPCPGKDHQMEARADGDGDLEDILLILSSARAARELYMVDLSVLHLETEPACDPIWNL